MNRRICVLLTLFLFGCFSPFLYAYESPEGVGSFTVNGASYVWMSDYGLYMYDSEGQSCHLLGLESSGDIQWMFYYAGEHQFSFLSAYGGLLPKN